VEHALVLGLLGGTLLAVVLLWLGADGLLAHRVGRVVLACGALVLPLTTTGVGFQHGMSRSSNTSFCMECHEMQPYGKSLFVDDPRSLPALHFQRRLVSRESACYTCHTDYALFGDVRAKLNGLRHVWVHYTGVIPDKITLYAPYPNANCLHCHDDARSYLEAAAHAGLFELLRREERSCLGCHSGGHALDAAAAGRFWEAQ
jgi:cytochrome c-type protein NapC